MHDFRLDFKDLFKIFIMDIQQLSSECITYDMHDFGLHFKHLLYLYHLFSWLNDAYAS